MSESENDEVKEIKISDIKDKFIEKEKEEQLLKKKKQRKINKKKKRNKINLLNKYKDEINNKINDDLIKNENLLIKKQKLINLNDKKIKKNNLFKKNNILFKIDDEDEDYQKYLNPIKQEILDFKNKHFFGNQIRQKNFLNKI
jgi:hypothetical protein